jgi:hypothetical protein
MTWVKIIRKYTDSSMDYTKKGFITLAPVAKVIIFFDVIKLLSAQPQSKP